MLASPASHPPPGSRLTPEQRVRKPHLAGTPERPALLHPARRQRALQLFQHQRLFRSAREDRLDDVGREQRHS